MIIPWGKKSLNSLNQLKFHSPKDMIVKKFGAYVSLGNNHVPKKEFKLLGGAT
jgi:hypothetical protein